MSVVGHLKASDSPESPRRDPRAVAAWCTAVVAAVLGAGQLLAAQILGVLTWRGEGHATAIGIADEAALVIWLAAVAVGLGAAAPRILLRAVPGRRMRLALPAVAGFGALLAIPVATATAAWAQLYGGDLSQFRAVRLVLLGVVLGGFTAILAVRSRAMAWGLAGWLAVGWTLLVAAIHVLPDQAPGLGHLDPGPQWSDSGRLLQARLLLIVLAGAVGTVIGVAAVYFGWKEPATGGRQVQREASLPLLAAASGPALMLCAYGLAAFAVDRLYSEHVIGLALAVSMAVVCAYAGSKLARRTLPECAIMPA